MIQLRAARQPTERNKWKYFEIKEICSGFNSVQVASCQ